MSMVSKGMTLFGLSACLASGLISSLVVSTALAEGNDPFGCASDRSPETCNRSELKNYAQEGKRVLSYGAARERMFQFVDVRSDNSGGRVVDDVYSNESFALSGSGIPKNGVNCEHTWPQSKLKKGNHFSESRTDLFHLFPSSINWNSTRGSLPFADIPGEPAGSGRVSEVAGGFFEPPEVHKGIVARALFYVAVMYDLPIPQNEEQTLRAWATQYPVTQAEKDRAARVEETQGNRNPFIDNPQWISLVNDF